MHSSRFDRAAAVWDEEPARVRLARKIARTVRQQVPVRSSMTAVDYGCGTGLLTLALAPAVRRIIGADSSPGMLAKLEEKIRNGGFPNAEGRLLDLTVERPPADMSPDLIVTSMALHHIADVPRLLVTFWQWMCPNGYLALADLDREDGSFHQDATGVYHTGFDREWLTEQLWELGLRDVRTATAHVIERPGATGASRRYPVFAISGRKPGQDSDRGVVGAAPGELGRRGSGRMSLTAGNHCGFPPAAHWTSFRKRASMTR